MIDNVEYIIDKFEAGYIFTADDFSTTVGEAKNVSKILNHFVATDYLRKLSKGKFYKPKISKFGELPPDTTLDNACQRLMYLIGKLDEQELCRIKKLALKYTPQAIALLGAILEIVKPQEDTSLLFKKLNPITVYKLGISAKILPTQKKWNIQ